MKRYIGYSILAATIVFAASPIHDSMDNRIKGKSYTGSLDDNVAAQDGLGILPLQHHTGTTDMNNELLVQKVFNRIVKSETDKTKTVDIRTSMSLGLVGTATDLNLLSNAGTTLSYQPGSLSTCKEIKAAFPNSTDGVFNLKTIGNHYCDMTTDGGGWTMVLNLDTSDGNVFWWKNARWTDTVLHGETTPDFSGDYKGGAWNTLATGDVLMMIHDNGSMKGWRSYKAAASKTMNQWLNSGDNVTFTSAVLNSNIGNLWANEHLLRSGKNLVINSKRYNVDWDRIIENQSGISDNNGGGLGNWHDVTYSESTGYYRTTSEFQAGWGTCYGTDKLGFYGTDTAYPATNNCSNVSGQSNWSSRNGINYDIAMFIR